MISHAGCSISEIGNLIAIPVPIIKLAQHVTPDISYRPGLVSNANLLVIPVLV